MSGLRPARPADCRAIAQLCQPFIEKDLLIKKDLIAYFEDVQEFVVFEHEGQILGCGALHVFWEDIGEVRTLAVDPRAKGRGIGSKILSNLLGRAASLGLCRVFCLTFETSFFRRFGFREISGAPVGRDVYEQMLRSHDDGLAQFLELAATKPNTLGNTRMLLEFADEMTLSRHMSV